MGDGPLHFLLTIERSINLVRVPKKNCFRRAETYIPLLEKFFFLSVLFHARHAAILDITDSRCRVHTFVKVGYLDVES